MKKAQNDEIGDSHISTGMTKWSFSHQALE